MKIIFSIHFFHLNFPLLHAPASCTIFDSLILKADCITQKSAFRRRFGSRRKYLHNK